MTTTIVTALLPAAVRIIGWVLDARDASVEERRKWLDLLEGVLKRPADASRLRKSYQDQLGR